MPFGEVQDVKRTREQEARGFKGHIFLMFATAAQAFNTVDTHVIDGITVRVKAALGTATSREIAPTTSSRVVVTTKLSEEQPVPCRFQKSKLGCKFGSSCAFLHL